MNSRVAEALKAANETKSLLIAPGALKQAANLFKEQFGNQKAIIIADQTTYSVAGEAVKELFDQNGIQQEASFIFTEPELHAEYQYVEQLQQRLGQSTAIPVVVGSGTINDLTKLSAHLVNRSYCMSSNKSLPVRLKCFVFLNIVKLFHIFCFSSPLLFVRGRLKTKNI